MQPSILKYTPVLSFPHNSETALRSRTNFIYRFILHQLGTFLVLNRSWFSRNQHFSPYNQLIVRAKVLSRYASLIIDGQMSIIKHCQKGLYIYNQVLPRQLCTQYVPLRVGEKGLDCRAQDAADSSVSQYQIGVSQDNKPKQ